MNCPKCLYSVDLSPDQTGAPSVAGATFPTLTALDVFRLIVLPFISPIYALRIVWDTFHKKSCKQCGCRFNVFQGAEDATR